MNGRAVFAVLLIGMSLLSFTPQNLGRARDGTLAYLDQLIVARSNLGKSTDPHRGNEGTFVTQCYEPLIFFDGERVDRFVPWLASSWSTSEDGRDYTFVIRDGVKFHSGNILTPEDVEYSFERNMVAGNPNAWWLYDTLIGVFSSRDENGNLVVNGSQIDQAITHNETTVTFHLIRPYPAFLQFIAMHYYAPVMEKKWCVDVGEWPGTWNNWTDYNGQWPSRIFQMDTNPPGPHKNATGGTGPYMLDYFIRGEEVSFIRFDDYWRGWPAQGASGMLGNIIVKKVVDYEVRKNMLLSGESDSLDFRDMSLKSIGDLLGQPGVRCVYPLPSLDLGAMFFGFYVNTTSPYLGVLGVCQMGLWRRKAFHLISSVTSSCERLSRVHLTTLGLSTKSFSLTRINRPRVSCPRSHSMIQLKKDMSSI